MTGFVLRGGRVVDPRGQRDQTCDVRILGGGVAAVGKQVAEPDDEIFDVGGAVVAPGFVDLHTHLRDPGRTDEETVASGSAAAAAGGFTAICAMPNTDPVADSAAAVERLHALGREVGLVEVVPAGALTVGLAGERMAALGEMATGPASVRLFTDDGKGLQDALLARRIMEYLRGFDAVYAEHCEDAALASGAVMNEGAVSSALGLRGAPTEAEEVMAARDISLCRLTGCRLHLLHVSAARTVALVRAAKDEGLPVTAEAAPHHFTLTEEAVAGYDTRAKVNPPLRGAADRDAIIRGLADGTIDAIATDHAPHTAEEKDLGMAEAPPGLIGLETALALTITELVDPGHLSLSRAVDALSCRPAEILGVDRHGGPLVEGAPANLVVLDPAASWTVTPELFYSKSRNTPFAGRAVRGRVIHTIFEGRFTVRDGRVAERVTA